MAYGAEAMSPIEVGLPHLVIYTSMKYQMRKYDDVSWISLKKGETNPR